MRFHRLHGHYFALSIAIGLAWVSSASAVSLTLIADTNTPIPNGTGNFTQFTFSPTLSGGTVAFRAAGNGGQQGIYTGDGTSLTRVADLTTPIPDGVGNFTGFSSGARVGISASGIAFSGFGSSSQQGIYTTIGGGLSKVVDRNTQTPEGTGTYTSFSTVDLSGTTIGFGGSRSGSPAQVGLYTVSGGGAPVLVVNNNTPLPSGGGTFSGTQFSPLIVSGTSAVFRGLGPANVPVLALSSGGVLTSLVDTSTAIPGGTGNFTGLAFPDYNGTTMVFTAAGSNSQSGLYASTGGTVSLLADTNTPIPEGMGNFTTFFASAINADGLVATLASGSNGQSGIYLSDGSALSKVVAVGDSIEGHTVSGVSLVAGGFDGSMIAFQASFSGGSSGLYVATVPEASTFTLAIIGLVSAAAWRLQRTRHASSANNRTC